MRAILSMLTAAVIALAVSAGLASGETPCRSIRECLSRGQGTRWDALDKQLLLRAQQYRDLLVLREQARRSGNTALLAKVDAALPQARANWEYIDGVARKLQDQDYKAFLARRAVSIEDRIAAAQAELHRKTDIFDGLRKAQGSQKASLLREMEGLAREEQKEALQLGLTSGLALAGQASRIAAGLASRVGGVATTAEWQKVAEVSTKAQKFAETMKEPNRDVMIAVKGGITGYKTAKEQYYQAAIEGVNLAANIAGRTAKDPRVQQALVLPTITKIVLNLVAVAQTVDQFGDAERRFHDARSEELRWQTDIAVLGDTLKGLRDDRERAREAIQREELFEQTVRNARATVGQ